MADTGDIVLYLLSGSVDGLPTVVTATAVGSPQDVHTHVGGTTTIDQVTLFANNCDDAAAHTIYVIAYGSSPADPTHVICKYDVPTHSGPQILLDGYPITNGKKIAVYADAASKFTVFGRVGRATVSS